MHVVMRKVSEGWSVYAAFWTSTEVDAAAEYHTWCRERGIRAYSWEDRTVIEYEMRLDDKQAMEHRMYFGDGVVTIINE